MILPISCEIASGTTACGDGYVIQDVKSEERRGTRQLVFTSNLRAVQSEIGYHIVGTKKRKKIFEFDSLFFSIHQLMATALLHCPPLTPSPSLLVLGL